MNLAAIFPLVVVIIFWAIPSLPHTRFESEKSTVHGPTSFNSPPDAVVAQMVKVVGTVLGTERSIRPICHRHREICPPLTECPLG